MGCFATDVVSLEVLRRCLSEVRSVELLGLGKSGAETDQLLKILTAVIRAYDGHAECCLNLNVYDISVNCEF